MTTGTQSNSANKSEQASSRKNPGEASPTIKQQGLSYLLVGGLSAAIDLGGFQLLYTLLHWPLAVSSVTSIVVSTAFNFLMNRNATFKSTSNPARSLLLYLVLLCANTVFTTVCISLLVQLGIHSALAKVFTMTCTTMWNFVLYRKIIFK